MVHVTEPVDGGVARCVVEYVRDQVRRGWAVTVVSPSEPSFISELDKSGYIDGLYKQASTTAGAK